MSHHHKFQWWPNLLFEVEFGIHIHTELSPKKYQSFASKSFGLRVLVCAVQFPFGARSKVLFFQNPVIVFRQTHIYAKY
jgi:hypothetical protein